MHELSAIVGALKTIEKVMNEQNLTKVDTIVLQIGEFSGIVPSYIEEYFPTAVFRTRFEGARLELETIPGIVRCNACGAEFNAFEHDFKCPSCQEKNLTPISGREFLIKEIHAY